MEIQLLKRREAEETTRNHNLAESLSRITNDIQALRPECCLELSVSKYQEQAQEKDGIVQTPRVKASDKDIRIENLSVQLQTFKQSAEESSVPVSQKQSAIVALFEELLSKQENTKTGTRPTTLDKLNTEKAQKEHLARQ